MIQLYHAKVLLNGFQLNGHTIGFRKRTQELELHSLLYMYNHVSIMDPRGKGLIMVLLSEIILL